MPDWLTHLGAAYIGSRIFKIKSSHLVLLGAILPDLISRLNYVIRWVVKIDPVKFYAYTEPYHTPFMVFFLAMLIALFFVKFSKAFFLIYAGSIAHYILDLMQKNFNAPKLMLYPFNYEVVSLQLFWPDESIVSLLMIISFFVLIYALKDKEASDNKFYFSRAAYAVPLILFLVAMPILTYNSVSSKPLLFQQLNNPGNEISIPYGVISGIAPKKIRSFNHEFEVVTDSELKKGEMWSIKAKVTNGKLYPYEMHKHNEKPKLIASLIGLIFLVIFWFKKAYKVNKED